MNALRKILLTLMVFGFGGLILLNSGIWTARMTILDRDVTKSWLNQSNVYENFVDELADLVQKDQAKRGGNESDDSFDVDALTRAAKKAFPPENLKKHTEYVLNAVYDWLEQTTSVLVIDLDFSKEKADFIEALGSEGLSRLTDLPACGASKPVESFDIFSASCLPSGTNAVSLVNTFKSEMANSTDVLPDTSVDTSDITIDYKGKKQPFDVAFSEVPVWYGLLTVSPLILTGITIINSGLILLLSKPRWKGLKTLGWFFGIVGGLQMLVGLAGMLLRETIVRSTMGDEVEKGLAENILLPIIREISFSVGKWNLIIGSVYVVLAIVLFVIYFTKKKKNAVAPSDEGAGVESQPPADERPKEPKPIPKIQ